MNFKKIKDDLEFRTQIETCPFPAADFDHRAHLRLAYIYLCEHDTREATELMRETLQRFQLHKGVDPAKYHATITRAWILAVRHFMAKAGEADSADEFIDSNPQMLDSKIMMTHYSAAVLFSDRARGEFVEPDLDPIPRHRD